VDSLASAKLAAEHGAERIELNAALELGGLTPSIGLTEQTVATLSPHRCAIIAMARPRPGGFTYDTDARTVMQQDIDRLLAVGVDGVALGVLNADGTINQQANRELMKPILQAGKQAVFHRAFDLTPDPIQAIDILIELGFSRVLTSGQAPTALEGASLIRKLIEHAAGRIEVLPGSGITPDNVEAFIHQSGCDQVHASLHRVAEDDSGASNPAIQFSSALPNNGGYHQADPDKVSRMMKAINPHA
jgi:copper homeostasis protein